MQALGTIVMQVFWVLVLPVVFGLLSPRLMLFPDSFANPIHQTYWHSGTSTGGYMRRRDMLNLDSCLQFPVFRASPVGEGKTNLLLVMYHFMEVRLKIKFLCNNLENISQNVMCIQGLQFPSLDSGWALIYVPTYFWGSVLSCHFGCELLMLNINWEAPGSYHWQEVELERSHQLFRLNLCCLKTIVFTATPGQGYVQVQLCTQGMVIAIAVCKEQTSGNKWIKNC